MATFMSPLRQQTILRLFIVNYDGREVPPKLYRSQSREPVTIKLKRSVDLYTCETERKYFVSMKWYESVRLSVNYKKVDSPDL